MADCIDHLKASAGQFEHPMLLPMILFRHGNSTKIAKAQRNTQDMLQNIERALSFNPIRSGQSHEHYFDSNGLLNLDYINRALSECHELAVWTDPNAYLRVLDGFDLAIGLRKGAVGPKYEATEAAIVSRINFSRRRLEGQAAFREVILQRLDVLRNAVS
jgi:hypothetical protein